MDRQLLFTTAVTKLIEQGQPAFITDEDGNTYCRYRADDGCQCALGHNIPDDKYDPEFEDRAPYSAAEQHIGPHEAAARLGKVLGVTGPGDAFFLREMQSQLHDDLKEATDFVDDLKVAAARFASKHNLNMPQLTA